MYLFLSVIIYLPTSWCQLVTSLQSAGWISLTVYTFGQNLLNVTEGSYWWWDVWLWLALFTEGSLHSTGVLISPQPDQEGNKLQRQKILICIYPIYNHNWKDISSIYRYNKTSIKWNILTINKIHREVGRAKDLSAPLIYIGVLISP